MFSLESPHLMRTHSIPFQYKNENHPMQLWDVFKELRNEFEPAVVNEPPVFDPLKFYCI